MVLALERSSGGMEGGRERRLGLDNAHPALVTHTPCPCISLSLELELREWAMRLRPRNTGKDAQVVTKACPVSCSTFIPIQIL